MDSAFILGSFNPAGGVDPENFFAWPDELPPGQILASSKALASTPPATINFGPLVPPPWVFSPGAIPDGLYGSVYAAQTLTVTGGVPPYTFSISANSLPPGMSLSTTGIISGTPTASGTYSFTVTAQDNSRGPGRHSGSQAYTLVIDQTPLTITANPASMTYGQAVPALTVSYNGFANGDNASSLTTQPTITTTATPTSSPGIYPIEVFGAVDPNYIISYIPNYFTITIAMQQIIWAQNLIVGCNDTPQIQLTATATSGLPVTYSVSDPNIASVSGNLLTLLQPGTTFVTATQTGNANYAAAPPVIDSVVYQSGSLISQHWNDVIFFDSSSGDFVQWQWYKNGQAVAGATAPYYSESPSLNGQYFVIATNLSGQQVQSCTLSITAGAAIPGGIKVFPNPAQPGATVNVASNYPSTVLQGAVLQLVDVTGRVLQQLTSIQQSMKITMPPENGIYIINLLLTNGQNATTNVLVAE